MKSNLEKLEKEAGDWRLNHSVVDENGGVHAAYSMDPNKPMSPEAIRAGVKAFERKAGSDVQHQDYYTWRNGKECVDVINEFLTSERRKGFFEGNLLKYLYRWEKKGKPVQDLKKARVYLDYLIDEAEKEEKHE